MGSVLKLPILADEVRLDIARFTEARRFFSVVERSGSLEQHQGSGQALMRPARMSETLVLIPR